MSSLRNSDKKCKIPDLKHNQNPIRRSRLYLLPISAVADPDPNSRLNIAQRATRKITSQIKKLTKKGDPRRVPTLYYAVSPFPNGAICEPKEFEIRIKIGNLPYFIYEMDVPNWEGKYPVYKYVEFDDTYDIGAMIFPALRDLVEDTIQMEMCRHRSKSFLLYLLASFNFYNYCASRNKVFFDNIDSSYRDDLIMLLPNNMAMLNDLEVERKSFRDIMKPVANFLVDSYMVAIREARSKAEGIIFTRLLYTDDFLCDIVADYPPKEEIAPFMQRIKPYLMRYELRNAVANFVASKSDCMVERLEEMNYVLKRDDNINLLKYYKLFINIEICAYMLRGITEDENDVGFERKVNLNRRLLDDQNLNWIVNDTRKFVSLYVNNMCALIEAVMKTNIAEGNWLFKMFSFASLALKGSKEDILLASIKIPSNVMPKYHRINCFDKESIAKMDADHDAIYRLLRYKTRNVNTIPMDDDYDDDDDDDDVAYEEAASSHHSPSQAASSSHQSSPQAGPSSHQSPPQAASLPPEFTMVKYTEAPVREEDIITIEMEPVVRMVKSKRKIMKAYVDTDF